VGGPSPLWGPAVPVFHTQNNTRNRRTERSPQECPVIGADPQEPQLFISPLEIKIAYQRQSADPLVQTSGTLH
jgi:hypothetical protein